MASCYRIAHKAYLLIDGQVAASGSPEDLAFGDNEISRDFIAKSGIDPGTLTRIVDR